VDTRAIPTLGIDYAYLTGRADDASPSPILVTHNNVSGKITGHVLTSKGTGDPYSVEQLARILRDAGQTKLILKSDREPAILDLKTQASAVARARHSLDIIPEESPEYEHQANGAAEVAVREVKAQARSLRFAVEELHGCIIGPEHVILPWLVSYGASMVNRCRIGADGLTAHQRQFGRPYRKKLPTFSEKVLYKPLGLAESRLDDKFSEGIYCGLPIGRRVRYPYEGGSCARTHYSSLACGRAKRTQSY